MPTVTKSFVFLSDAEGLVTVGTPPLGVTFGWDGADGNPTGCVKFSSSDGDSGTSVKARRSSTGQTWETWGVPSGGLVTSVQVTGYYRKRDLPGTDTASLKMRVVNSSAATVLSGDSVSAGYSSGTDSSWVLATGVSSNVNSSYQASTTDVRLELDCSLNTAAVASISVDQIDLVITYSSSGSTIISVSSLIIPVVLKTSAVAANKTIQVTPVSIRLWAHGNITISKTFTMTVSPLKIKILPLQPSSNNTAGPAYIVPNPVKI